jgi:hypothetical protein
MYRMTVITEPQNASQEKLPPIPLHKAWLYHTDTNTWLLHLEGQFTGVGVSAVRANAGVSLYDLYGHFRPVEIQITCTDKDEFLKLRGSHKVSQIMLGDPEDGGVDHISVSMTNITNDKWTDVAKWSRD